jgi:hypothetical protein
VIVWSRTPRDKRRRRTLQIIEGSVIVEDLCWHLEVPQARTTLPVVARTTERR